MKKISMILGLVALTLGIHLTAQAQFPFPGQQPVQNPVQTKPMAFSIGADVSEIPASEARGTRAAETDMCR